MGKEKKRRVTLENVAHEAGVSITTVSNVLRGRPDRVTPETTKLVLAAAYRLGYPSVAAPDGPPPSQTGLLGAIIPNWTIAYVRALEAVEAVATRSGFDVITRCVNKREEQEASAVEAFAERRVDGIVFIDSSEYHGRDAVDAAAQAHIPFVVVNRVVAPERGLHLVVENEKSLYEATHHLISLGHTKIGYLHLPVQGPHVKTASIQRMKGFRQAMDDFGLPFVPEWVRPGSATPELAGEVQAAAVMNEIIDGGGPPSAMLCGSDFIAIGVIQAAASRGLTVPEDLAVVGFEDTPLAPYTLPPLSSVRPPMEEAGTRAAEEMLRHLLRGKELKGVETFPGKLIVRESSTSAWVATA